MNFLVVDTNLVDLDTTKKIFEKIKEKQEEIVIIPKDIDIMRDVSIDWMIMVRDELDRRIKAACME